MVIMRTIEMIYSRGLCTDLFTGGLNVFGITNWFELREADIRDIDLRDLGSLLSFLTL